MRRAVLVLACALAQAASAVEAGDIPLTSASADAISAFRRGRDLFESSREFEARTYFEKALALDPKFAFARAMLAQCLTGDAAAKEMASAVALAAPLGDAERAMIDYWSAVQRGDDARVERELTRLGELAPGDFRIQVLLGERAVDEGKGAEAVKMFRRAVELNPQAAEAYNHLGFALSDLSQHDAAVVAMRRYAALKRDDPNPLDSLGEVLLRANRLADAEASFRRASAAPQFWYAAAGVATARFFQNDFEAARAALREELPLAPDAAAKVRLETLIGWSFLVEGRIPEGLAALNAAEATARAANALALYAELAVTRGAFFVLSGDAASALPLLRTALERTAGKKLNGADLNTVRRGVVAWRVRADAQLGRAHDAEEALATLEAEAVTNRGLGTVVRGLRPLVAEAHGDVSSALALTAQCASSDWLCRADRIRLAEKMGDAASAADLRRALVDERRRDTIWSSLEPTYLWVWSRLRPKATVRNDVH